MLELLNPLFFGGVLLQTHYQEKLEKGLCWRVCNKVCPLGKGFLKELYSWSEANPLHPLLAWKICEPCYFEELPIKVKCLTDKNFLLEKGKIYEIRSVADDETLIVKHPLAAVKPTLFKGEYVLIHQPHNSL